MAQESLTGSSSSRTRSATGSRMPGFQPSGFGSPSKTRLSAGSRYLGRAWSPTRIGVQSSTCLVGLQTTSQATHREAVLRWRLHRRAGTVPLLPAPKARGCGSTWSPGKLTRSQERLCRRHLRWRSWPRPQELSVCCLRMRCTRCPEWLWYCRASRRPSPLQLQLRSQAWCPGRRRPRQSHQHRLLRQWWTSLDQNYEPSPSSSPRRRRTRSAGYGMARAS
mmetsp:Transcript_120138/g.299716  ORF Transcript_120138/g.299716 Transcript_120138/m.299716 type:complete len:221 (-) Transcript_120138:735-1397(-)